MKIRTILLTVALVFAMPFFANGQIGNLLKNKAAKVINAGTKTLNKEIDKEIDTAAQKGVQNARDKAYENMEQNKNEAGEAEGTQTGNNDSKGFNIGGLLGGKVTSKYNETYSFSNRIYMQMEIYDKKEVSKQDMFIYFNNNDANAAFEIKIEGTTDTGEDIEVKPVSITDAANKCFMAWIDAGTMKMGMISEIPDGTTVDQQAAGAPKLTFTRTGNTRDVAGYKCSEIIYKEEGKKEYGKLWVTKDLRLTADKRTFSKAGLPASYSNPGSPDEMTLAMESYDDKNVLQSKMETKEINFNFPRTFSTAGVTFRQINFNQAQGQNKK